MKIYTKTGDQGKSSLLSGERVSKNHRRIEAYGDVDELNSVIGAVMAALPAGTDACREQMAQVQSDLFQVGAWLATTPGSAAEAQLVRLTDEYSQRLETYIDAIQADLPELKTFILPGGHPSAAWAHVARTVCRRAERRIIDLAETDQGSEPERRTLAPILAYINRLSDYLFVLARLCNHAAGVPDVIWQS